MQSTSRIKIFAIVFLCLLGSAAIGLYLPIWPPTKKIVLTFDDIPMPPTHAMGIQERTDRTLKALSDEDVRAVFFSVGSHIPRYEPESKTCMKRLSEHGHIIANHSFSHEHLSGWNLQEYIADVRKCEEALQEYPAFRKWFRYPYLDIGKNQIKGGSLEKAVDCAEALKQMDYRHGYVTVDSYDWYINHLFVKALQKEQYVNWEALERFYLGRLRTVLSSVLHRRTSYVKQGPPVQVLLFHANDLNALFLPSIIRMLKEEGWELASPEEAFDNPKNAYNSFDRLIAQIRKASKVKTSFIPIRDTSNLDHDFQQLVLTSSERQQ